MALYPVANTDRVLAYVLTGVSGATATSNYVVTQTVSTKVKANNKGLLETSMSWTVGASKCTAPEIWGDAQNLNGGAGALTAATTTIKADNKNVIIQEKTGTCNCIIYYWWPYWLSVAVSCTVKISSGGQTKVNGQ